MSTIRATFLAEFGPNTYQVGPAYNASNLVDTANISNVLFDFLVKWGPLFASLSGFQIPPLVWTVLRIAGINELDGTETFIGSAPLGFFASGSGDAMPAFNAALVQIGVFDNPRNAKMFLPGFLEEDSGGQNWEIDLLTELSEFAFQWSNSFVGVASGLTFTPGMWSTKNLTLHSTTGTSFVETLITHQNRRKVGIGS